MSQRSNSNAPAIVIGDEDDLAPVGGTVILDEDLGAAVDEDADLGGELPKRATRNDDGSITLTLRKPLPVLIRSAKNGERTETYSELTFHDLVGADIRAITAASEASRPIVMLAKAARLREALMNSLFDRMPAAHISYAQTFVSSSFGAVPKGKSAS